MALPIPRNEKSISTARSHQAPVTKSNKRYSIKHTFHTDCLVGVERIIHYEDGNCYPQLEKDKIQYDGLILLSQATMPKTKARRRGGVFDASVGNLTPFTSSSSQNTSAKNQEQQRSRLRYKRTRRRGRLPRTKPIDDRTSRIIEEEEDVSVVKESHRAKPIPEDSPPQYSLKHSLQIDCLIGVQPLQQDRAEGLERHKQQQSPFSPTQEDDVQHGILLRVKSSSLPFKQRHKGKTRPKTQKHRVKETINENEEVSSSLFDVPRRRKSLQQLASDLNNKQYELVPIIPSTSTKEGEKEGEEASTNDSSLPFHGRRDSTIMNTIPRRDSLLTNDLVPFHTKREATVISSTDDAHIVKSLSKSYQKLDSKSTASSSYVMQSLSNRAPEYSKLDTTLKMAFTSKPIATNTTTVTTNNDDGDNSDDDTTATNTEQDKQKTKTPTTYNKYSVKMDLRLDCLIGVVQKKIVVVDSNDDIRKGLVQGYKTIRCDAKSCFRVTDACSRSYLPYDGTKAGQLNAQDMTEEYFDYYNEDESVASTIDKIIPRIDEEGEDDDEFLAAYYSSPIVVLVPPLPRSSFRGRVLGCDASCAA